MSASVAGGTVIWNGQEVPLDRFEGHKQTVELHVEPRHHPDARPAHLTTELSGREAQVLWMYGGQGMTIKAVSSRLGLREETGKSYLKRIRQKLRARMLDEDVLSIEVGTKRGLYLAALDECRHFEACRAERDRLLRRLLSDGAPERMSGDASASVRPVGEIERYDAAHAS